MRAAALISLSALVLSAPPAPAEDNLAFAFTLCAGRLEALSEYQWLFSPPDHPRTAARRDAMITLAEAVDPEARLAHVRAGSRRALRVLLDRGSFSGDTEDMHWARRRAAAQIEACTGFLEHRDTPMARK